MLNVAAALWLEFNPEHSWAPTPTEFLNMTVEAFWWVLALLVALSPIVVVLLLFIYIRDQFS